MKLLKASLLLKVTLALTIASLTFVNNSHAADVAKGKKLFAERCASCHGAEGAGDGPVAAALPPEMKPKNLKDGNFKYATDDAKFKDLLKKGGAAVGLNPLMTGAPDLGDADLDSLIAFVRTLKK